MLSFSAAISPWASTAIERVRSPLVTAVATSAMARTWVVRLAASWLTFSVSPFQVPAAPGHLGLAAELPLDAHLAGHGGHLLGEGGQRVGHLVDRVGQRRDLPLGLDDQLPLQVAVGDGGDDLGDPAHLAGEVAGHAVDAVGQVLPDARHAADLRLAAELPLGADLAGDAGDLARRSC